MRERTLWSALVVVLAGAAILALAPLWSRSREIEHSPPHPEYGSLDEALEALRESRWEVAMPPRQPGPYRLASVSGMMLSAGSDGREVSCVIRDTDGSVREEVKLQQFEHFDQMLVDIESANGLSTAVVLQRRSRD